MKPTNQLRVFLLYARGDREAVDRLYRHIVREGFNVWLDREKLLPGQDWQYEIRQAIHASDLVIVCLSRQFIKQGGYRHEELKIALKKAHAMPEGGIFIVPARVQRCNAPASLCRWHWVDLFEPRGYRMLMKVLRQANQALTK